eukprot:TRINITY_DN942_c0_g1_i3.p1 TRINITY_DN942_c0_g1~~TRINITY_DN942_c0_g1_i3.p1  ORF type:complete len:576 (-),score=110.99 TRINITY_DN942_c0_g1_i3:125-1852(-)
MIRNYGMSFEVWNQTRICIGRDRPLGPTFGLQPTRSVTRSASDHKNKLERMRRMRWVRMMPTAFMTAIAGLLLASHAGESRAWQADLGDGTFHNPPLYADYPDPDIIRVGGDFYFATTTFANVPGLTILHSRDLVNWEFVSHVIPRLQGREQYDLKNGNAYRGGVFAPSLRYHRGVFYVVVTPVGQNTRIYHTRDLKGLWDYYELDRPAFDPALYIEPNGKAYIATSGGWDGTVTLLSLSDDFSRVTDARKIHYNKGAEGSKIVKRGDWYYLFNSIPSRLALIVSRARNLLGPWETKEQIDDRSGGHQGAIVDLPDGDWYGFVMVDAGSIGRMTNISPVFWENDWPVWGSKKEPGKVPAVARKPIQGQAITQPVASDDFSAAKLGLQWQWNHNPDDSRWSLTERPGYLRLRPTESRDFWTAKNTLIQKGQGPWSRGDVKLDIRHVKPGDHCGFGTLGKFSGLISVSADTSGKRSLGMSVLEDTTNGIRTDARVASVPITVDEVYLRMDLDFKSDKGIGYYSLDGKSWVAIGGEYPLQYDWQTGTFQGEQFALFCYNENSSDGYLDVDSFRFDDKK